MSLGQLTSDVFLSCTPTVVATTFTAQYCFTALAACPTSEWTATYTIREVCTGDPATWTQPPIPPNFIKTIVTCDVCEHKAHTITCPVEQAIQTGSVKIHGNGVTATPALAAATATVVAVGAADTAWSGSTFGSSFPGPKPGGGPADIAVDGLNSDSESGPLGLNSGSPAAAAAAIVGSSSSSGTGSSGTNSSSDTAMSMAGHGSVSGSSFSGDNSGSAAVAATIGSSSSSESGSSGSNLGLGSDGMLPTISMMESNTKTDAASSDYDAAGAPSLKNSTALVLGALAIAFVASQILL